MNIILKIGKKTYYSFKSFAKEIYLHHNQAFELIKSEKFLKVLYKYNQNMYNNIVDLLSQPFQIDALLFKVQYILNPLMSVRYYGYEFKDFIALGKKIISFGPQVDIYLKDFLKYELLSHYMEVTKFNEKNYSLYQKVKELEKEFLTNENKAYFKLGFLLEADNIISYNGKTFKDIKEFFSYVILPVNIIDFAKDFRKSQYVFAWLDTLGYKKEIILFENLVTSIEQKEKINDSIRKI